MKIYQIDQKRWQAGLKKLQKGYRLFGPVKDQEFFLFKPLNQGEAPNLAFQNTRLSAKGVIYPQSQAMFDYSLDEKDEDHHRMREAAYDDTPRALIGIRPCDADAFMLVGRNFDTPDYKDPYWLRTVQNTTLVGYACDAPCQSCFCTTAGSGPYHDENLDVLLVDAGDAGFLAHVLTDKGQALINAAGWDATESDAAAEKLLDKKRQAAEARVSATIKTENLRDTGTMVLYEAPFWEDVAFSCINCGTCTYLCPTCWCFDIQDETHGKQGQRMRNWDSCMFPLFTLHGSGHNPRGTKVHRVRQRFMHKLKYYVDKYDDGIQCVGCGRCVQYCPVNIDIRKVAELMNRAQQEADACAV